MQPLIEILSFLCLVAYLGGLVAAGWRDCASYTIPNRLVAVVALAAGLAVALRSADLATPLAFAGAALAVLVGGAALFFARVWGAGDAKLLAAASLVTGPHGLAVLLLWSVLAGGVLATFLLLRHRLRFFNRHRIMAGNIGLCSSPPGVPYGAAIAAGGVAAYFQHATVLAGFGP
jgi:prepilin peptidase CpaA